MHLRDPIVGPSATSRVSSPRPLARSRPGAAISGRAVVLASLWVTSPGCYASHARPVPAPPCSAAPPTCVTRASPCAALALTSAECVADAWQCPAGSEPYTRPWADERCLPLEGRGVAFIDGVHEAPVPVPIGDRCAWALPASDGTSLAFVDVAPSCAELGDLAPLEITRGDDYDYLALGASLELPSGPAVLVRGWAFDASAPFGVRGTGVGLSDVRGASLGTPLPWIFESDTDLGDAALVWGEHVYAYGCPGDPRWLVEDCIVGRAPLSEARAPTAWEIFGVGGWGLGEPAVVFGSGPHRGPVLADPRGGLVHVFAAGFGSTIEVTRSSRPEGPWSAPTPLVPCELPASDPGAYCSGPIVHLELFDPTRPAEIVVSYAIGTTSPDGTERRARTPRDYWPRVVRIRW